MTKFIAGIIFISIVSCLLAYKPVWPQSQQSINQSQASQALSSPFITRLFFYPKRSQNTSQQDRDQYECYIWSYKKTGFDPSRPNLAPHQKIQLIPAGTTRHQQLNITTDTTFSTNENNVNDADAMPFPSSPNFENSKNETRQYNQKLATQHVEAEKKSSTYRRALTACMEGRGYIIQQSEIK